MRDIKIIQHTFIFSILFLLFVFSAKTQPCASFHKSNNCKLNNDGSFKNYGQSKSAMLEVNKKYEYKLVLYGDKDYKIGVCTENGLGTVHYKIINARSSTVLYDNISDDYIESVGFTNEFTQSVIIEVTILVEDKKIKGAYDKRGCIGINILWRKAPQLGF